MAIVTDLPIPVFNVFKYFFTVAFIETIARGALQNIWVFFRRRDLHFGQPSPLQKSIIDRYNLANVTRNQYYLRAALFLLLIVCFYGVEISFESSTDAVNKVVTFSEKLVVYNATYGACHPPDDNAMGGIIYSRLEDVASNCVQLTSDEYVLYKPVWIKGQHRTAEFPLCVKLPTNVLARGKRIYGDRSYSRGSPSWSAVANFVKTLQANSRVVGDQKGQSYMILNATSTSLVRTFNTVVNGTTFLSGYLYTDYQPNPIICSAEVRGKYGEGVTGLTFTACAEFLPSGNNFLRVYGTARIPRDASDFGKYRWSMSVSVQYVFAVPNFTTGVFLNSSGADDKRVTAYGGLLSRGWGQDAESLNRYAVVYKHCADFRIAHSSDKSQLQELEIAGVEEKVVGSISLWGFLVVVFWSMSLWTISVCLHSCANHQKYPNNIHGECSIAQLWADYEWTAYEQHTERRQGSLHSVPVQTDNVKRRRALCRFLTVKLGKEADDIAASKVAFRVQRDPTKPFKSL